MISQINNIWKCPGSGSSAGVEGWAGQEGKFCSLWESAPGPLSPCVQILPVGLQGSLGGGCSSFGLFQLERATQGCFQKAPPALQAQAGYQSSLDPFLNAQAF